MIRSNQDGEHHCAGFLILLEKEGPNQMMRIAGRLGIYDASILDIDSPVYESVSECVEAHEEAHSDRLT